MFTAHLYRTVTNNGGTAMRGEAAVPARPTVWVTLALGGRAGERLAHKLGLLVSRSTLLRELRKRARPPLSSEPRVVGIDEWEEGAAFGK